MSPSDRSLPGCPPEAAAARPGSSRGEQVDFHVDLEFGVIHEDAELLVIDKPSPLPVHAVGSYGQRNLLTLLGNDPRWAGMTLRTVHRLDAETSGVLLVAKTSDAARSLGLQFNGGQVRKEYRAVVFGRPAVARGVISARLGYDRSSGFQTLRIRDEENGEPACTAYEVLSSGKEYSLVRLRPETGRTHQLRVHMAILGHPIVGDKIYVDPGLFEDYVRGGMNENILKRLRLSRLALHASMIAFTHPASGTEAVFSSPLPAALRTFMIENGVDQPC